MLTLKNILIITFTIIFFTAIVLLIVYIFNDDNQKYYCYDALKNSCVISKSCNDGSMLEYECNDKNQKFCYNQEFGGCIASADCKYNLRKEECENTTKQRKQLNAIVFDANKNVTVNTSGDVTQWKDIDGKYTFFNKPTSTSKLLTYGNNLVVKSDNSATEYNSASFISENNGIGLKDLNNVTLIFVIDFKYIDWHVIYGTSNMSVYSFDKNICFDLVNPSGTNNDFNISTTNTDNFIDSLAIIVITLYNNPTINATIRINGKQQELNIVSKTNETIKLNLNDNALYYGNFGEIIHYDKALTTEQIIIEEKYLAGKWDVSLNS